MNTHEYQAREILARYDIPFVPGNVAETCNEVAKVARELGGQVVVKAQIHAGGRGKAGGIKLADTPEEASDLGCALLGSTLKGHVVRKLLVAEQVSIAK